MVEWGAQVQSRCEANGQRRPYGLPLQTQELFSVPLWKLPFYCFYPGLDQDGFPKFLGEGGYFPSLI